MTASDAREPVILMVDDNRADHDLIRFALQSRGVRGKLLSALDGREGQSLIADRVRDGLPLDVVLLDLNMPLMDGRALLRWLRDSGHLAALPTIILTSSSMPQDRSDCLALGASEFWIKPSRFAELLQLIERLGGYLAAG